MSDVLTPKREAIDRLKKRFESYRETQNIRLQHHEKVKDVLSSKQKQDTWKLQQRFLESKAKKAKKNDHRSAKESLPTENQRNLSHSKGIKRTHEEASIDNETHLDDKDISSKVSKSSSSVDQIQSTHDSKIPSFSVQIVQQFTSSHTSQNSQTIKTNVTVKALPGNISPNPAPAPKLEQPQCKPSTSIECKQERSDQDLSSCCNDISNNNNNNNDDLDMLANDAEIFSFVDDSGDDMFKNLIDDVFHNGSDLMKDFNFDDNVSSIKDESRENFSNLLEMGKCSFNISSAPSFNIPKHPPSYSHSTMDFKLSDPSPAAQTLKQMAEQHQNMKQQQINLNPPHPRSPYNDTDSLTSIRNNFPNQNTNISKMSTPRYIAFNQTQSFAPHVPLYNPPQQQQQDLNKTLYNQMPEMNKSIDSSTISYNNQDMNPNIQYRPTRPLFHFEPSKSSYPDMVTSPNQQYGTPISQVHSTQKPQLQPQKVQVPTSMYLNYQSSNQPNFQMGQSISIRGQFSQENPFVGHVPDYKTSLNIQKQQHHMMANNQNQHFTMQRARANSPNRIVPQQIRTNTHDISSIPNNFNINEKLSHQKQLLPRNPDLQRTQRPPNINIGPDGLNISQKTQLTSEWHKVMMQQQARMKMPLPKMTYANNYRLTNPRAQTLQQHHMQPNGIVVSRQPINQTLMQQHQEVNMQGPNLSMQISSSVSIPSNPNCYNPSQQEPLNLDFLDSFDASATDLINFDSFSESDSLFDMLNK